MSTNNIDTETRENATAPYNFIALNHDVVKDANNSGQLSYISNIKLLSGYLDLSITNKTPLFIRGEGYKFYKCGACYAIPGSTMRGMIRTLMEIITYSKFLFFNNEQHYMRYPATSQFDNIYKSRLEVDENAAGGYLVKEDGAYFITPAAWVRRDDRRIDGYKILENSGSNSYSIFSGGMNRKFLNWKIGPPKAINGTVQKIPVPEIVLQEYQSDIRRAKEFNCIAELDNHSYNYPVGLPVFYKAHANAVLSFGHTRYYRLKHLHTVGDYLVNYNEHAGDKNDFSSAIFGTEANKKEDKKGGHSGKIFFEDCIGENILREDFLLKIIKILGSPNSSYFPHYLMQNEKAQTSKKELATWSSIPNKGNREIFKDKAQPIDYKANPELRGYKCYWHQDEPQNYIATKEFKCEIDILNFKTFLKNVLCLNEESIETVTADFKPVKGKIKFDGDTVNEKDNSTKFIIRYLLCNQITFKERIGYIENCLDSDFKITKADFLKYLQKIFNFSRSDFDALVSKKPLFSDCNLDVIVNGANLKNDATVRNFVYSYLLHSSTNFKLEAQNTIAEVLAPGKSFSGRIRFDNFSEEELGALMMALDLQEECLHKIGMAKPYGLGSVKINASLTLIDRQTRYDGFCDENGKLNLAENTVDINNPEGKDQIQAYKNAFAKTILNVVNEGVAGTEENLWKEQRMQDLKTMLTWDEKLVHNDKWGKETAYLELKKFRNKIPLPSVQQIKEKLGYGKRY